MKATRFILIFFILFISHFSYSQCDEDLLNKCYPLIGNYKFLKSYPIKMKQVKKNQPPTVMKQTIFLQGGLNYKIASYNQEGYSGKVVLSLYSEEGVIGTNYDSENKKFHNVIQFRCNATGIYYLTFYFDKGQEGCSIVIIAQEPVKRLED